MPPPTHRPTLRRLLRWLAGIVGLLVLLPILAYAALLGWVHWHDPTAILPDPAAGTNDVSGLAAATPAERFVAPVGTAEAQEQLRALVLRAAGSGQPVTIAGSRHSMGGHTMLNGALAVDMRVPAFAKMELRPTADPDVAVLRVGAGATWTQVLRFLDARGWSVQVMQAYSDFTIGGSLSVNGHGWQHNAPPVAGTVESFRLLKANGEIVDCRRGDPETGELFRGALGGYGLLGIILDADLRVIPNAWYRSTDDTTSAADYATRFRRLSEVESERAETGMAYGRVNVTAWHFLRTVRLTRLVFAEPPTGKPARPSQTLAVDEHGPQGPSDSPRLKRLVYRASVGTGWTGQLGKLGRYWAERAVGEVTGVKSRTQIQLDENFRLANRDPGATEILHEYFVPGDALGAFLEKARPILQRHPVADLLNITVRNVRPDPDSILAYSRHPDGVFGLVMIFHYAATPAADEAMMRFTRELVDLALQCEGTYYLPYRPHPTLEQFRAAYPACAEFYRLKRKHDPTEVFQNQFYQRYVRPAGESASAP